MGRGRAWACESIEQGGGWGKQEHRVPLPALCLSAQFSPNSHAPSSLSLSLSLSSPAASCYAVVSPALSLSLLACSVASSLSTAIAPGCVQHKKGFKSVPLSIIFIDLPLLPAEYSPRHVHEKKCNYRIVSIEFIINNINIYVFKQNLL